MKSHAPHLRGKKNILVHARSKKDQAQQGNLKFAI